MSSEMQLPKQVMLYCKPIDLRMGCSKLLGIVRYEVSSEVTDGRIYLFSNKSHSLVKGIFWDRTGYVVFSKRLESGRFHLPLEERTVVLESKSLRMFLDGLKLFL